MAAFLEGILETLKLINTGLQAQEKTWQWLEERLVAGGVPEKLEREKSIDKASSAGEGVQEVG